MNKIKVLSSLLTATVLTVSSLSAQEVKQRSLTVGAASSELMNQSGITYSLSLNSKITTENNIVWGGSFFGESGSFEDIEIFGAGAEVILGYQFTDKLATYAIVGGKQQTIDDDINAYGVGFGVATQYGLFEHFAVEAKYMSYSMDIDPMGSYDNPNISLNLKVTWE